MEASIARWGNSLAIRLPKIVADKSGLKEGDTVAFLPQQSAVLIKKQRNIKRYELADALKSFRNAAEAGFDWGAPKGREVW